MNPNQTSTMNPQGQQFMQAIKFAQQNPQNAASVELMNRIKSGQMNDYMTAAGFNPSDPKFGIQTPAPAPTPAPTTNDQNIQGNPVGATSEFGSGVSSSFKSAQTSMGDTIERQLAGKQSIGETILQGLGVGAKLGNDIIGNGLKALVDLNLSPDQQKAVGDTVSSVINNSPVLKAGLDAAKGGMDSFNQWAQKNPKDAASVSALINIPLFAAQFVGLGEAPKAAEAVGSKVGDIVDTGVQGAKNIGTKIGEVATTKADNMLTNSIRETASKYVKANGIVHQAESLGSDPVSVLAGYGKKALPAVTGGKLDTNEAMDFLKSQVKDLSGVKSEVVKATDAPVSWAQFRKNTEDLINSQPGWTATKKAQVLSEVNKRFNQMVDAYGSKSLPLSEVDKIKTEETGLSKAYNNTQPAFQYDTHGIIGKAARNLVESGTGDANVQELNKLIQSHYDAIDLLKALNGKAPSGGILSRSMARIGGEIVGGIAGSTVGHPLLGIVGGRLGADSIENVLQSGMISNPLKRMIINSFGSEGAATPEEVQTALDYIAKQGAATIPKGEAATPEAMAQAAAKYQPEFQQKVQNIADRLGVDIQHGPPKTAERIAEKGVARDLNRSVILAKADTLNTTLQNVVREAKAEFGDVTRIKMGMGDPTYGKIIVNVPTPHGEGEIQLTTPDLWSAKTQGGGDVLYHAARNPNTPADIQKLLTDRMNEIYSRDPNGAIAKAVAGAQGGGFTQDLLRNIDYGGSPHISVSPYPERSVITTAKVLTGNDLANLLVKNLDLFSKEGYAAGGWYDAGSGQFYGDVSVPVPKTMASEAAQLGTMANQKAGFDLEKFKEVPYGGTGTTENVAPLAERQALVDKILANKGKTQ